MPSAREAIDDIAALRDPDKVGIDDEIGIAVFFAELGENPPALEYVDQRAAASPVRTAEQRSNLRSASPA